MVKIEFQNLYTCSFYRKHPRSQRFPQSLPAVLHRFGFDRQGFFLRFLWMLSSPHFHQWNDRSVCLMLTSYNILHKILMILRLSVISRVKLAYRTRKYVWCTCIWAVACICYEAKGRKIDNQSCFSKIDRLQAWWISFPRSGLPWSEKCSV